ncbi:ProbableBRG0 Methyltransferase adrK [Balamuthia mandrillaris]
MEGGGGDGVEQAAAQPTLTAEDLAFLALYRARWGGEDAARKVTEEQEVERLRQHVLSLWRTCLAEAKVLYRCVRQLSFLRTKVDQHFHYPVVLETINAGDPSSRFLDLGCCFGTDTRRVILDGWEQQNIVAVDVTPFFWNCGLQLYEDEARLKLSVCIGDVTSDPEFVQSLLKEGSFAHVWTGAVLHVLSQQKVEALLASVLVVLKNGGTYFGTCVGTTEQPKEWQPEFRNRNVAYLHTAQSLTKLLQETGFQDVVVHERSSAQHAAQRGPDADSLLPKCMLSFAATKPKA